jgi:hypothetical protein
MKPKLTILTIFCLIINSFSFLSLIEITKDNAFTCALAQQTEMIRFLAATMAPIEIVNNIILNETPIRDTVEKKTKSNKNKKSKNNHSQASLISFEKKIDPKSSIVSKLEQKGFLGLANTSLEYSKALCCRGSPGVLLCFSIVSIMLFIISPRSSLPAEAVFALSKGVFCPVWNSKPGFFILIRKESDSTCQFCHSREF